MYKSARGFTLVELLVSMAIITVVFGVIITSSQAIQRASRDAKRQSDLQNIQSALERYYSDQDFYPSSLDEDSLIETTGNPKADKPKPRTYLNKIPSDPKPLPYLQYLYEPQPLGCDNELVSRCNDYCLYTKLENPPGTSSTDQQKCNKEGYNYYLTQP